MHKQTHYTCVDEMLFKLDPAAMYSSHMSVDYRTFYVYDDDTMASDIQ